MFCTGINANDSASRTSEPRKIITDEPPPDADWTPEESIACGIDVTIPMAKPITSR